MRKVLFILCLFYLVGFIQCAQKCVEATGKLYCRRNPAALSTAEVRLYDRDGRGVLQVLDPDDLMGMTVPADDGSFKIHGCGDDADWIPSVPNPPDPYVQIRHTCKSSQGDILLLDKDIKFFPEKTELASMASLTHPRALWKLHWRIILQLSAVLLAFFFIPVHAQFEETRCRCVCPNPSVVQANNSERKLYILSVPARSCVCEVVVLPQLEVKIHAAKIEEFCVQCECQYQSRNTTLIKVAVILVISTISFLVVYMLFLQCLNPMLRQRRKGPSYEKHVDEDENIFSASASAEMAPAPSSTVQARQRQASESVLKRMEHRQSRWMAAVNEQRRKIYTDHTILN